MVPSMDLLKALFSSCLEWLNWLKQIPDILMLLCQSKLHFEITCVYLVYLKVKISRHSILGIPHIGFNIVVILQTTIWPLKRGCQFDITLRGNEEKGEKKCL